MGIVSPTERAERYKRVDWSFVDHPERHCRDAPLDIFFPCNDKGVAKARKVCQGCPVRMECLNAALITRDPGIWGGTTEVQRRAMRELNKGG